jgi:hypothetical protein
MIVNLEIFILEDHFEYYFYIISCIYIHFEYYYVTIMISNICYV